MCVCSCPYVCVNEKVREKECYDKMNVNRKIFIFKDSMSCKADFATP